MQAIFEIGVPIIAWIFKTLYAIIFQEQFQLQEQNPQPPNPSSREQQQKQKNQRQKEYRQEKRRKEEQFRRRNKENEQERNSMKTNNQQINQNNQQQKGYKRRREIDKKTRNQKQPPKEPQSNSRPQQKIPQLSTFKQNSFFRRLLFTIGFVTIQQGHVGIYKTFGILNPTLLNPGLHFVIPYVNYVDQIQVSVRTDFIENIPCGTSTGTLINFQRIEIVHKLNKQYVYDTLRNYSTNYNQLFIKNKLYHEVNQFCSKHTLQQIYITKFDSLDQSLIKGLKNDISVWAPGIQVLSMRITKPIIPQSIRQNYQIVQRSRVQLFIAEQERKILIQKEQTRHKEVLSKANSQLEVKLINLQKQLTAKQNELKMQEIQAKIYLERQKAKVDGQYSVIYEQVIAAKEIFTEPYLRYQGYECFNQNITFHLGDSIPNIEL